MFNFSTLKVNAKAEPAFFATQLFCNELNSRVKNIASFCKEKSDSNICFEISDDLQKDEFEIAVNNDIVTFSASGIRGLVYAIGMFLRKLEISENGVKLVSDISKRYSPDKGIRGHQMGYRTTPNSYDAWTYEQYYRYYLDLMFFGVNTVEHMPYEKGYSRRNRLMLYDEEEFLVKASEMADELNLDVSLWHPNCNGETHENAVKRRKELYAKVPRLNYVFIPGGDPGDLPADVFLKRCILVSRELKKIHPEAQMWPSAQMPHGADNWPKTFISGLKEEPEEIDGIIYGPNHALPLKELREKTPEKYDIRFYPDITHNVRCEYPVHYYDDDWHFSLASCLSRECTNPRLLEFTRLYGETKNYVIGSVSYSEGITDDVNKVVWSALDFDNNADTNETLEDYARLFFFGTDAGIIADLILGLEKNWENAPEENDVIDLTYDGFHSVLNKYDFLGENWRFLQLILRANCDKLVRDRRIFELNLIEKARKETEKNNIPKAIEVLNTEYPEEYRVLREEINSLCAKLFDLIGLQTDVENYCADSWERGAILETIDRPITDKYWLLSKLAYCDSKEEALSYFNRNKVKKGEYYFSVALNGVQEKQSGEVYMNFQGDRPESNDGTLPTALFNVFDNQTFRHTVTGLSDDCEYILKVTYLNRKDKRITDHTIMGNDTVIYCGPQFGEIDEEYNEKYSHPNFITAKYIVPKNIVKNGELKLLFKQEIMCVMFSEFRIEKA